MDTYTTQPPLGTPVTPEPAADPSTTDQAKDKAQEAAGQAKEKAGSQLRAQVDQRSNEAGQRVSGLASDVRSVGTQLREQGKDQPARLAEQAADRAERLGGYLTENDAERILGDVEDFGRRQPWVVIGGGIALGIVASRFLKASSARRYEQRSTGQLPARVSNGSPAAARIETPVTPAVPAAPTFDVGR